MVLDKLPPHDIAAEESVVAACLVDPEAIFKVAPVVKSDDFFREKNGWVFDACVTLWTRNEAINQITVAHELARRERLEAVGGVAYLSRLIADLPTVVGVEYYAQIVARDAIYRRLISAAGQIAQYAYEGGADLDAVLNRSETLLMALRNGEALRDFVHIKTLLEKYLDDAGNPEEDGDTPSVIRTGFIDLDTLLGGLKRSDLVLLAARPSVGKCLAAGSTIVLSDGSVRTIEEIYQRREAEVLTLGADWRLRRARPTDFVANGVKPVFRIRTRLGRCIEVTAQHPLLCVSGWKTLADIQVGDHIAVPRRVDAFGSGELPEYQAKILGYLIGDGGLTGSIPMFTNANPAIREDFLEAIAEFGGLAVRVDSRGRSAPTLCISADHEAIIDARQKFAVSLQAAMRSNSMSARTVATALGVYPNAVENWRRGLAFPSEALLESVGTVIGVDHRGLVDAASGAARKNGRSRLTRWLESLGLWGRGSHDKFVPEVVFHASRSAIAMFLNRLFATDGWATVLGGGNAQLGYASVSERLARQVQHLLLRFGVIASLRQRSIKYRDQRRPAWQLDITDARSIRTFADEIGIYGKESALQRVLNALDGRRYQTNCDLIPVEIWGQIAEAKGNLSWAEVARRMGFFGVGHNLHVGKRALSRHRLGRFADALDDPALLALAESDVYWDRVESIDDAGEQQVYDLTIPDTHNFVANDIVVHNSALAMSFARNAAVGQQAKVAVFNLEMSGDQLAQRLMAAEASVDSTRLRLGEHTEVEERRIMHALGILSECDIYIDDSPVLTVGELRGKVRRLQQEKGLDLLIIDYLQLMQGNEKGNDNRVQEISFISRSLKNLARELNVPIVALSQLSRAVESRKPPIPMMSDLRESGSLEQDADVVMFIYREDYYTQRDDWQAANPEQPGRSFPHGIAQVIVAKHRNGPVGTVDLRFQHKTAKFEDLYVREEGH
ncbi:MAG: replicative DNA helicase [Dehalococcoidia bacterium]